MSANRRWSLMAAGFLLLVWTLLTGLGYAISQRQKARWKASISATALDAKELRGVERSLRSLQKKIARLTPSGIYIVIDSGQNRLYLKKGQAVLREAVISCGSGNILVEPGGQRRWIFDTPRGVFRINSKLRDPSWKKPDWAFIEEGEKIPQDPRERIENGMLGEYALGFGDGYFIHGTLYTRLLGRSVTHGCIRMGDEDLEALFRAAPLGTPVLIF